MSLSSQQMDELVKLKKLEKQYEGIIRTSINAGQQERAKVDLKKIKDRITEIDPRGLYGSIAGGEVTKPPAASTGGSSVGGAYDISSFEMLSKFQMQSVSPHCTDKDINMMFTILEGWQKVFMTALFDKHVKLDYSLNSERDTHYIQIDNVKRFQKALAETIEDHYTATREDSKNQLFEMKRRYARQYLNEGASILRKLKAFWEDIDADAKNHGTKCTNIESKLIYDPRFEEESFLKGEAVSTVIHKAVIFLTDAIKALRLPELPDKKGIL